MTGRPFCEHTLLFPRCGRTVYRIPSIAVTKKDTLIAFADKRKGSFGDWGHDTDIVLRRSCDGGRTWLPEQVLVKEEGVNYHSGPSLVDKRTGRIFMCIKRKPSSIRNAYEYHSEVLANVDKWRAWGMGSYIMHSDDEGATWSSPVRLELDYRHEGGTAEVANGVSGIQLADGRLVLPAFHEGAQDWKADCEDTSSVSFLIISSDGGLTWQGGAEWPAGYAAVEYCLAELDNGDIYINQRSLGPYRKVGWLPGPEMGRFEISYDVNLPEPVCHAGLTRIKACGRDVLIFVNPAVANHSGCYLDEARRRLTVRSSFDNGKSWRTVRVLAEGRAGYAALAAAGNGFIFCLYEHGVDRSDEEISVARFNCEWLSED